MFANRLGWARTYLKKAGLITYVTWGVFQITDAGEEALLHLGPEKVTLKFLKTFPGFLAFYAPASGVATALSEATPSADEKQIDPEGAIESGFAMLKRQVESELLEKVKGITPQSFEDLVVKLILGMGYGGSQQDAGRAIGRSGDGGIDGVIQEDRLGLDVIYLQAERWEGVVGRPVVQAFVGALHGRHAGRGILLTTSSFTKEATDYAKTISDRVILIDGTRLVSLMFEYSIGVRVRQTYLLKALDPMFFEDLT